ncbi:hypothetical protein EV714DRAFT_277979 [Schizophyllum commune]
MKNGVLLRPRAAGGTRAAPRAKDAKVKGPFFFTPHSRRRPWVRFGIFADTKPPEASAGSLGKISEEGGTLTPLTAFTRVFADREPPKASAGSLGEGCGGGAPSRSSEKVLCGREFMIRELFASPKLPEACARTPSAKDAGGNSALRPFYADAPPFKRLETDIFDEKDPSTSSLPTSLRSTLTSQLSTTPLNASGCDAHGVAER